MKKEYGTMVLEIKENGKINTDSIDSIEKNILTKRDVVYVYIGEKNCYVGQTTNFKVRHGQHINEKDKFGMKKYQKIIILYGQLVDKNLNYLEKRLITLFKTDNYMENKKDKKTIVVENHTDGNNSNNLEDAKILDSQVIVPFWENELFDCGCINNREVSHLKNSILFKYSPFMELSEEQDNIVDKIVKDGGNFFIEGGSGTGKTVLLTNIVARIDKEFNGEKRIGVVGKLNWLKNYENIFSEYGFVNNLSVYTWGQLVKSKEKFDYILVDEAHKLPRYYTKQHPTILGYFNENEDKTSLQLLHKVSKSLIVFYDRNQAITPADIPFSDVIKYVEENDFSIEKLSIQFRINVQDKGKSYSGDDYIKGVKYALQIPEEDTFNRELFNNKNTDAYFGFSNSIKELFDDIDDMDNKLEGSQNRVLAGEARPWISQNDKAKYDWIEGDNKWQWNDTHENWMNRKGSREQIGSCHAVAGVDINCVGVVIGKDLTFKNGRVIASVENHFQEYAKPMKLKKNASEEEKLKYIDECTKKIVNKYYLLLTRGIDRIRIYIEDEALRNHFHETFGMK